MKYLVLKSSVVCLLLITCLFLQAQEGTSITLKKPKKYENRTLASEKSDTKKFGTFRHALQNMYTHYNYYYNGNSTLNNVVAQAKESYKDDYTKLLSFYNYSLNSTAQNNADLDSVIYHCTAGILLHDLRNNWIDNLYFLLGKAYFFRMSFDSAMNAFQYVNYAWGPKDEGYNLPIGSNATNKGEMTIATKEKTDVWHKIAVTPPSRNENFLWMARASVETGNDGRAAGLLEILRNDPKFPQRLLPELHEAFAYLYYNQKRYDSAAVYLGEALDNASNQFEKARWEYLMAQMFHLGGNDEEAAKYYNRCANHTPDPIMEVNAYLNSISLGNDSTGRTTQQKLDALLHMAKKDKYVLYRDIIYYAAAQVQLQIGNNDEAIALLKKSIANNVENPEQRIKSFLLLADVEYNQSKWINAHNFYDSSLYAGNPSDSLDRDRLNTRQPAMASIANYLIAVDKEDSLQQVAAMPEAQRTAYLKKELRQIRRSQGLKDEENTPNFNPAVQLQTQQQPELFSNPTSSKDWYFNNTAVKSSGFGSFRQQWGNRPNVDNWRRQSAITKMTMQPAAGSPDDNDSTGTDNNSDDATDTSAAVVTFANSIEELEANLPLTPEKMQESNKNIAKAYFQSGEVFQNQLQNYPAAIDMYQRMNQITDSSEYREQSLFNLYFCYDKLGKRRNADSALAILQRDYRNGTWLAKLNNNGDTTASESSEKSPATRQYEKIYTAFIEGNFSEAKKQKEVADSLYGNSYWTPQLLYIESIYYVSQREDSSALEQLQNLQAQFPSSPLAEKASTMADVIRRRPQIEAYLTNLQIKRNEDTTASNVLVNTTTTEAPIKQSVAPKKLDSTISKPVPKPAAMKVDTVAVKQPEVAKAFFFNAADSQYVALVLDKVAPVYATEAKNAFNRFNKQTYYNQQINISSVKLDERYDIMLIGPFTDAAAALDYIDKTRPQTTGRILPWLTADKYGYLMISPSNFRLLNENKDLDTYKSVIQKAIPGKF